MSLTGFADDGHRFGRRINSREDRNRFERPLHGPRILVIEPVGNWHCRIGAAILQETESCSTAFGWAIG